MATTAYGVNHPLAVKVWSKKLMAEALKETFFNRFMGSGSNAMIQLKTELGKGKGDQVTFGLRMQLAGDGVVGDGTLEGNEEALSTYSDQLTINQLRHAVRSAGKMSEQRVPFSVREEAMAGLRDWWADRFDRAFITHLTGNTLETRANSNANNTVVAPDSAKMILAGGAANEAALSSSNTFTLSMLDTAVATAKTISPMIRPIRMNGNDMYVAVLHPYQVRSLRTNTNAGQWLDIQKAAMMGGDVENNPIFKGSLGVYNNTILFESARIPTTASNVYRGFFAGAQAGVCAFGSDSGGDDHFSWTEELFDYGNQLGVSAGSIFGIKKTRFNSADFGVLTLSSWATVS